MKYGLLAYSPAGNIGDQIQSIAARQFLPHVDLLIDREKMRGFRHPEPVQIILNGWYMCKPRQWPPADPLVPLLASIHITPEQPVIDAWLSDTNRAYLERHGPVGTRDTKTLELLRRQSIPAYFSGCLTLTLRRNEASRREDYICAVDVDSQTLDHLRRHTTRTVIAVTHWLPRDMHSQDAFIFAEMLLDLYQRAHCVVTSRLHAALPCLALDTPVLLLENTPDDRRFAGLDALARHASAADYLQGRYPFDLERPGANPSDYLPLRQNLIDRCTQFIGPAGRQAYDAHPLRTFGELLPVINVWEKEKNLERAIVQLRHGRVCSLLAAIADTFKRYKSSKRKF